MSVSAPVENKYLDTRVLACFKASSEWQRQNLAQNQRYCKYSRCFTKNGQTFDCKRM